MICEKWEPVFRSDHAQTGSQSAIAVTAIALWTRARLALNCRLKDKGLERNHVNGFRSRSWLGKPHGKRQGKRRNGARTRYAHPPQISGPVAVLLTGAASARPAIQGASLPVARGRRKRWRGAGTSASRIIGKGGGKAEKRHQYQSEKSHIDRAHDGTSCNDCEAASIVRARRRRFDPNQIFWETFRFRAASTSSYRRKPV